MIASMRYFILFFATLLFSSVSALEARADIVNEFIQIQCLNDLNALKIDTFNINGERPRQNALKDHKRLWNNQGIALAESLIEYGPNSEWQSTKSIQKQCSFYQEDQKEKQTYYIDLESYVFSGNPNGQCGLLRTFELSIKTKNNMLVDKVRFWEECGLGQSIYNMTLTPHEGYIIVNGTYPDLDGGKFYKSFYKIFHLEDDLPITNDMVYTVSDK